MAYRSQTENINTVGSMHPSFKRLLVKTSDGVANVTRAERPQSPPSGAASLEVDIDLEGGTRPQPTSPLLPVTPAARPLAESEVPVENGKFAVSTRQPSSTSYSTPSPDKHCSEVDLDGPRQTKNVESDATAPPSIDDNDGDVCTASGEREDLSYKCAGEDCNEDVGRSNGTSYARSGCGHLFCNECVDFGIKFTACPVSACNSNVRMAIFPVDRLDNPCTDCNRIDRERLAFCILCCSVDRCWECLEKHMSSSDSKACRSCPHSRRSYIRPILLRKDILGDGSRPSDKFHPATLVNRRLKSDGAYEYRVRFRGMGPHDDQWEAESELKESYNGNLMRLYDSKQPRAPASKKRPRSPEESPSIACPKRKAAK